jgi:hypothetical protein
MAIRVGIQRYRQSICAIYLAEMRQYLIDLTCAVEDCQIVLIKSFDPPGQRSGS